MSGKLLIVAAALLSIPISADASYECSEANSCRVTCDGSNDNIDISAAIATVAQQGTVRIASGACTISASITIAKSLTLAGSAKGLTTFKGAASPMVIVAPGAEEYARVTAIDFESDVNIAVKLVGPLTRVRVDSNGCRDAYHCVYASGRVEGVIDSNDFVNCDRCVYAGGTNNEAWTIGFDVTSGNFVAGSGQMLFVESNRFERNASHTGSDEQVFYTQEGARTVFRHNTVDLGLWNVDGAVAHDSHGNQKYFDEPTPFRGQPLHEIYENTYIIKKTRANGQVLDLRSGSNLIFNNTIQILEPKAFSGVIELWEEEAESGTGRHFTDPGFDRVWPTEDMVTNTFIWNNTINGAPLTSDNIEGNGFGYDCCGTYPDPAVVINFNRDVWMHAPSATGGRTFYNGRPGASGRDGDGTLVFTPSGPNAYYPYSPYQYPHPMATKAEPPSNLHLSN